MPTVTSTRGTGNLSSETRGVRDVAPLLFELDPDIGPLIQMLGQAGQEGADNTKIEWFEDEMNPRFTRLSASLTAAATTMSVVNPTYLRLGDIIKLSNAENVRVTATPTANPVSITRGVGTTGGQAHDSGASAFIFTNAHAEGGAKRAMLSTRRVPQYNWLQIVKNAFGWTKSAAGTKQYAGQDKDKERNKKLKEQKRDIEQAFWFGERYNSDETSDSNVRTMGGVFSFITSNSKNAELWTEEEMEDFMRVVFRHGSKEKVLFGSPALITAINRFARGKLETVSGVQSYGVTMTKFMSAGRNVRLVEHNLFTNDNLNDLAGIAGYGAILDMQYVKVRWLSSRGTLVGLDENIQTPGDDQEQHQYISEVGLQFALEKAHGEITGVKA